MLFYLFCFYKPNILINKTRLIESIFPHVLYSSSAHDSPLPFFSNRLRKLRVFPGDRRRHCRFWRAFGADSVRNSARPHHNYHYNSGAGGYWHWRQGFRLVRIYWW